MALLVNLLLIILELWMVGGLVVLLHHISTRTSSMLLLAPFGALALAIQLNTIGFVYVSVGLFTTRIPLAPYVILPPLLMGLLLVYVVSGTSQSRYALEGVLLAILCTLVFLLLPQIQVNGIGISLQQENVIPSNLRMNAGSLITLVCDMILLIITYQGLSNLHQQFPSRVASGLALLAALWCDAIVFTTLSFAGTPTFGKELATDLIGKTAAGLLLWPWMAVYLQNFAVRAPRTAATTSRPTLDIITTPLRKEASDRYKHSLLRARSQINQLIVRATDTKSLLAQSSDLLAEVRPGFMGCIGLVDEKEHRLHPATAFGPDTHLLGTISLGPDCPVTPSQAVIDTQTAIILPDIGREGPYAAPLAGLNKGGFHFMAAFPMRSGKRIAGVLSLFAREFNPLLEEEIDLLQDLADDLAYALDSLDARRNERMLHAAAHEMQNGLVVTDLKNKVIYANPAAARILIQQPEGLLEKQIGELHIPDKLQEAFQTYLAEAIERGQASAEVDATDENGQPFTVSLRFMCVNGEQGKPANLAIMIEDITRRRQHEGQLVTLNQITTELVQIHETQDLMNSIFQSTERLMHADASVLFLVSEDGLKVEQILAHNISDEYPRRVVSQTSGLPAEAILRDKKSIMVTDVLDDPTYKDRLAFAAEYGIRSIMIIPLLFQETMLGALAIYYHKVVSFTDEHLQLGFTLAHTLAITIQNLRLYLAEQSQRKMSDALAQAAASLNSSLNLDEVLDQILEQALEVSGSHSANIMLIQDNMTYVARRRGYEEFPDSLKPLDEHLFSLATSSFQVMYQTGKPMLIANTEADDRWTVIEGTEWVKSYAGAPLKSADTVIGFLNVDSSQPNFFTFETARRLQAFAAHASIAIQNANLYQQIQGYAVELEDRVVERTSELKTAKERIEGILSSVPDAVFVLDEHGGLIQSNQAGAILLETARGQGIDLFAPDLLSHLDGDASPSEKTVLSVHGRSYQPLSSPLSPKSQQPGRVLVFRDVTRFLELDMMKSQFVSDVSHELRTPLTNLMIYLDLLTSVDDPVKRASYLDTLRRETNRLASLIEDLLTISRLEAGRVEIFLKPVDINRLASELVYDRSIMANSKGLLLSFETSSNLPFAQADPRLLTQAISNLLTNAINYTPQAGSIMLRTCIKPENGNHWLTIEVQDSGRGITPEEIPHIFERFYRGSASYRTRSPGTGLGLAISKEIVDRMGGRISVESTPGKGSIFTVWLRPML